ncbi:MAG: hypothetical protein WD355_06530 [Balneolaceae bacterium]
MNKANTDRIEQATVIIRAAGERTEALCRELILGQGVPEEHLFLIREAPFSKAMRTAFEIGIRQNLPWTYCVDADVLLRPGAVETMVGYAEKQPENVCEIQGYIMDKFFGGARIGGVHLYRTSLLPEAIQSIPEEGVNIRPERHTLGEMKKKGYPWKTVPYIVGTHDDEQYNADIYRKAFVQAVKHTYRAELFITLWRERAKEDQDFRVALQGFSDSIRTDADVYIDRTQGLYKEMFEAAGFEEKGELEPGHYTVEKIEEQIRNWEYTEIYRKYFPTRDGLDGQIAGMKSRFRRSLKQHGIWKTVRLAAGAVLSGIGKKIQ